MFDYRFNILGIKFRKIDFLCVSIIIIWVLVCSLIINDFNVKAYDKSNNLRIIASASGNHGELSEVSIYDVNSNFSNDSERCVFIKLDIEEISSLSGRSDLTNAYVLLHRPRLASISATRTSYIGSMGFPAWLMLSYNGGLTAKIQSECNYSDVGASLIAGITGTRDNKTFSGSVEIPDDIEYVNSWEDAKKYLIDGNEDVLHVGDPNEVEVKSNSNIPTPQKVHVADDGNNPTITWINPKGLKVSVTSEPMVEIQWKPTINLDFVLKRSLELISPDWITVANDVLQDYTGFTIRGNKGTPISEQLNAYNLLYDDKFVYQYDSNDDDYVEMIARNQGIPLNPVYDGGGGYHLIEAGVVSPVQLQQTDVSNLQNVFTKANVGKNNYRIRYYYLDNGVKYVSDWVEAYRTFGSDGQGKDDESINFVNNDDESVQNPTYLPYNNNVSNNDSWWFVPWYQEKTQELHNISDEHINVAIEQGSNDDGGFLAFFSTVFQNFPHLYTLFIISILLCIGLRIVGR